MSHDTLIHRIVRPAVRRIASTGVTPNQLTTVRLVTGVAAAVGFACGGTWADLGGIMFLLSMLFDRADGELARQTGQMSPGGHRYDLCVDCLCDAIAFIGIGIGLALAGGLGFAPVLLGAAAGIGIGVLFWQLNVTKVIELSRYAMRHRGVVVDPDDALALVPVFVWLGLAWPMLIAAAVITPAGAAWLGVLARRPKPAVQK
ncbi:CDP-alcohol phosphatidyltransferase family protein [Inquilinus sp. OTU3971]|uniref:CDP-alcohol phosphatidyltransferase family protein n=1 Tax=Inquilinus sp. OTU3971 TaxID=3043855 RepID=UPI00313D2363